jgi:hypothetical protein
LLHVGDQTVKEQDDSKSIFELNVHFRIAMLFFFLLGRIPRADRLNVLEPLIRNATALHAATNVIRILGREHGKYESKATVPEQMIQLSDLTQLESITVEKIEQAYAEAPESILKFQSSLLFFCKVNLSEGDFKKLISRVIENGLTFMALIANYQQVVETTTVGDRVVRKRMIFRDQAIAEIVDEQTLFERLELLTIRTNLDPSDRERIEFALGWLRVRRSGGNPEYPEE